MKTSSLLTGQRIRCVKLLATVATREVDRHGDTSEQCALGSGLDEIPDHSSHRSRVFR